MIDRNLRGFLVATLLGVVLAVAGVAAPAAHAVDTVASYRVQASVAPDGALAVSATITAEGAPGPIEQRFATTAETADDLLYTFTLEGLRVNGAEAGGLVTSEPGYTVVSIPVEEDGTATLEYTVRGAALATEGDTTTVTWRMLQGLSVPVREFEATVDVPGPFTMIDCAAGPPASPGACSWYTGGTHDTQSPTFSDGPRGAGEVVQVVLRFPAAVVAPNESVRELWSLDRAFSVEPIPLATALLLALGGGLGLWLLHRRFGRDDAGEATPTPIAAFRPVGPGQSEFVVDEGVRPGQVGTLIDERVDPVDVTATLLDLAVRGALVIRELPRPTPFTRTDWELVRGADLPPLRPYEVTLLDAVAPDGASHRVSQLGTVVPPVLANVQAQLYDDVVEHGWFLRRPDETRRLWTRVGWIAVIVALVVAGLAIAFTPFGLAALVLVALAVGVGWVGQAMPARTHKGASVLAGLNVLRGQLLTQPTSEMPHGRAARELSEVLPFAVVLGGVDRWLDGLAATDADETPDEAELGWYHGPDGWHLRDLPDSLRNFVTTVEGVLVTR